MNARAKLNVFCGWIFVCLVILTVFCGCNKLDWRRNEVVLQEQVIEEPLISAGDLGDSRLEVVWQNQLPIRRNEYLERLVIVNRRLYGLSSRNYMAAMNREKGYVIFSSFVGEVGFPVMGLERYEDKLFSIIGNSLVEINPETGVRLRAERLPFNVNLAAVRNSGYYYIAGTDRRIHALRADDKIKVFEVSADNDSKISSVIADEESVIFATDGGNCVSFAVDGPRRLWQFDAAGGIVGPIVKDRGSVFLASKDTNIYKLDVGSGKFIWKYQSGAIPKRGPQVTETAVYQNLGAHGLVAIDKGSGRALWQMADGVDLLAESGGKAYVMMNNGQVVVMDNKKGLKVRSVNLPQVSRYAVNMTDSKIYVADDSGRVACLKPIE